VGTFAHVVRKWSKSFVFVMQHNIKFLGSIMDMHHNMALSHCTQHNTGGFLGLPASPWWHRHRQGEEIVLQRVKESYSCIEQTAQ